MTEGFVGLKSRCHVQAELQKEYIKADRCTGMAATTLGARRGSKHIGMSKHRPGTLHRSLGTLLAGEVVCMSWIQGPNTPWLRAAAVDMQLQAPCRRQPGAIAQSPARPAEQVGHQVSNLPVCACSENDAAHSGEICEIFRLPGSDAGAGS